MTETVTFSLRPAASADCRNVFDWRNHPIVRQFSLDSSPISWETHQAWFANTLFNPARLLLIAEAQGQAIGVLRFDFQPSAALISIYLKPESMGQGWGARLLKEGTHWLKTHRPNSSKILAEILPANIASIKAFEKAGYQLISSQSNAEVLRYERLVSEP